ncbi:MAG: UDP-2,3-diacylglucosamine diphosphatase LpxI [Thalassovita sp.]
MAGLAILAGAGALPVLLSQARPDAVAVVFDGVSHGLVETAPVLHRFEKLGEMFDDLRGRGVSQIVMAGSMSRPPLDPTALDPLMITLAPRLMAAMQGGDDALLRLVVDIIEEQGFEVLGAHEVLPELTVGTGHIAGPTPSERAQADANRGADILGALAPVDVGQGCVVASGLCLGIETLQGTDFLLDMVAQTPAHLRRAGGGVFVKAPKRGQDLRVDMPAIGPDTIKRVKAAGLEGLVLQAGQVLILEREATLTAAKQAEIFILGQDL